MQEVDSETRFLAAISRAAAAELGHDHPLALAAREAASLGDGVHVQELLVTLNEAARDRILAAAHKEMREDIQAIWSHLPGTAQGDTIH